MAQGKTLVEVILLEIVYIYNRFGRACNVEHFAVERVIDALQHHIALGLLVAGHGELLDALNAGHVHVLGDFDGIGAPGCDHLAAGTDEGSAQSVVV